MSIALRASMIYGLLLLIARPLHGQRVGVVFQFNAQFVEDTEGRNKEHVEAGIALNLAELFQKQFKYWEFRAGPGATKDDPQIRIWLEPGGSICQYQVKMELTIPSAGIDQIWLADLFPKGYLKQFFGPANPFGSQWNEHITQQFQKTLLDQRYQEIQKDFLWIAIGKAIVLQRVGSPNPTYIPATLTPVRTDAALLTDARFELRFENRKDPWHLFATSHGEYHGVPSISAVVENVIKPKGKSLIEVDRINTKLRPVGFRWLGVGEGLLAQ